MFTRNLHPLALPWLMLADDGGDGGGSGSTDDDGKSGDDGGEKDKGKGGDGGAASGSDDGKGDETVSMPKAEADRLRAEKAAADRARKKAEREVEKRDEEKHREAGELEKVVTQKTERIEELEAELSEMRVGAVATRLGFRDPDDVVHRSELRDVDKSDEAAVESALKTLAKEKDYLLKPEADPSQRRRQRPGAGGGDNGAASGNEGMNAAMRRAAGRE